MLSCRPQQTIVAIWYPAAFNPGVAGIREMQKYLALIVVALVVAGCSRSAGNFGFGPPPSIQETRDAVNRHLTDYLHYPASAKDLRIQKPRPGCFYRGPGKRDICGYQVCISYTALNQRGGYVSERQSLWITRGYGLHVQPPATCPTILQDWSGSDPVALADFCSYQPKHPDCINGRKESYDKVLVAEDVAPRTVPLPPSTPSSAASSAQAAFETLQRERWRTATTEEITKLANDADRHLKDGPSARYLDVRIGDVPDLPGVHHYCGQVNAKNSWGAYGGYKRFYYSEVGFFAMEDDRNGGYFDKKCK